jgi:hypothetical protein
MYIYICIYIYIYTYDTEEAFKSKDDSEGDIYINIFMYIYMCIYTYRFTSVYINTCMCILIHTFLIYIEGGVHLRQNQALINECIYM